MEHAAKVSLLVDLQKAAEDPLILESLSQMKHGDYLVELWKTTLNSEIGKMFGESYEKITEDVNQLHFILSEVSNTPIMQLLSQFYAKYSQVSAPGATTSTTLEMRNPTTLEMRNPPSRSSGIYPY